MNVLDIHGTLVNLGYLLIASLIYIVWLAVYDRWKRKDDD